MSASTKRKLRQAAREAGTDKKTIALQEEAAKKAATKRKMIIWTAIVVAFIAIVAILSISKSSAEKARMEAAIKETALTVDGKEYSLAEMNYSYASSYQTFVNNYGSYASIFGLDTSKGLAGLASQSCPMGEEGETWRDYFLEDAVSSLKQISALNKYAEENGIALTEEEAKEIDEAYADLGNTAKSYGYASAEKFLSANYGDGVTVEIAKAFDTARSLASKAYTAYADSIEITDAEVAELYPSVNVRHILVKAVADEETGEFTDEAKEEAKAKAEEILAEWEAGDKTEDSFAALAEQYSEDGGSNTNGGLYENVLEGEMVQEFNDFCFDENRQSGDTGIVYGDNGSYAGYHVMYFVGEGDPAENETGRNNILSEKTSEWLQSLTDAVTADLGSAYEKVGNN